MQVDSILSPGHCILNQHSTKNKNEKETDNIAAIKGKKYLYYTFVFVHIYRDFYLINDTRGIGIIFRTIHKTIRINSTEKKKRNCQHTMPEGKLLYFNKLKRKTY